MAPAIHDAAASEALASSPGCESSQNHLYLLKSLESGFQGSFLTSETFLYILNSGDQPFPKNVNRFWEVEEYFSRLPAEATIYAAEGTLDILSRNRDDRRIDFSSVCRDYGYLLSMSSKQPQSLDEAQLDDLMYGLIHFCPEGRWVFASKSKAETEVERARLAAAFSRKLDDYAHRGAGLSQDVRDAFVKQVYEYQLSTTFEPCPYLFRTVSKVGFCYVYETE
ncbi:MAG: hypothetical protein WBG08_14440 [Litorimonas sp.]